MRQLAFLVASLCAMSITAYAQDEAPHVEVFAGYSAAKAEFGLSLLTDDYNRGLGVDVNVRAYKFLGVAASISGHRGARPMPNVGDPGTDTVSD